MKIFSSIRILVASQRGRKGLIRGLVLSLFFCTAALFSLSWAGEPLKTIRVGALQFGTVNWELDVIQHRALDLQQGVKIEIVPLGSKNASNVALLGGAVDLIVGDWIWVSRLRAEGKQFAFVPYSLIVGKLYAHPDADISDLADLSGKTLGIAGGPVDKNWLLLRAYSQQTLGWDLNDRAMKRFVAPPLLNQLMIRGNLSAALTFWHYGARLESAGMKPVIDIEHVLSGLGVSHSVPLLGWIFDETWANDNRAALQGFLRASYAAKALLETDDSAWEELRPMMKAENEQTFQALKQGYLSGIPKQFGEQEMQAAAQTFDIMAQLGGEELIGKSRQLSPGTFWSGFNISR